MGGGLGFPIYVSMATMVEDSMGILLKMKSVLYGF
jgi:hypothetical protein